MRKWPLKRRERWARAVPHRAWGWTCGVGQRYQISARIKMHLNKIFCVAVWQSHIRV